jgi:hypothetical protein
MTTARDDMSLRDWFAGQALARLTRGMFVTNAEDVEAAIADAAYAIADAMMEERNNDAPPIPKRSAIRRDSAP